MKDIIGAASMLPWFLGDGAVSKETILNVLRENAVTRLTFWGL
jgi:hypothetical protein